MTFSDVAADFVIKLPAACESPSQRFDEAFVSLAPLGLGRGECRFGEGWRPDQPESDKYGQRLADHPFRVANLNVLDAAPPCCLAAMPSASAAAAELGLGYLAPVETG